MNQTQIDARQQARERLEREATRGNGPIQYREDDLRWCLGDDYETEVPRLQAIADKVTAEKRAEERRIRAHGRVKTLADRILAERRKAVADQEMADAVAEAKRRLGLADE